MLSTPLDGLVLLSFADWSRGQRLAAVRHMNSLAVQEETEDAEKEEEEQAEDDDCVVRLRGLPFAANEEDIRQFFGNGICISRRDNAIVIGLSKSNLPTGMAWVRLATTSDFNKAIAQNKKYLGTRYIEVYPATDQDLENAVLENGSRFNIRHNCYALVSPTRIRLQGLPFTSTAEDIKEFLR